jgi:ROS/MUCR transcriptional regulator protein
VFPDYIACLEDGKKLKMLKRHLQTSYGLIPDAYQAKWGLPRDYPMVAPSYAATRSGLAKKICLGRKPALAPEPEVVKVPARRARGSKGQVRACPARCRPSASRGLAVGQGVGAICPACAAVSRMIFRRS